VYNKGANTKKCRRKEFPVFIAIPDGFEGEEEDWKSILSEDEPFEKGVL
jgi:hypothetical protein